MCTRNGPVCFVTFAGYPKWQRHDISKTHKYIHVALICHPWQISFEILASGACPFNLFVAIGIDPLNVDRFLECVLNVLKESGFRYVNFFGELDENGRNQDFEALNMYFTIGLALGISVADVLLLPVEAYSEYKTEALQEEYAPVIAKHILRNQEDKKTQQWARNLPPETLAKLFLCLTNAVEAPWFREDIKDKEKRLDNEIVKAEALVAIMKWITPMSGNEKDTEHRCSQFEKALTLMGGNQETCKSHVVRWQRFIKSWEHMSK